MLELLGVVWWPALLAACVAMGATLAIERWGGQAGGLIGSLPSAIVPASLGIWAGSSDAAAFADGMGVVPGGMLVDAAFLWCWRLAPRWVAGWSRVAQVLTVTAGSLLLWAVSAYGLVSLSAALGARGAPSLAVGAVALLVLAVVGVASCWQAVPAPGGSRRVGVAGVLARGMLAALSVGVAVAIAASGSPRVAGVATVFPAIFLTTMVSLWWSQGASVSVGAVGPIILGSTSVALYALLIAGLLPALGLLGVPIAWVVAVGCTSVPAWWWLRGRR